MENLRRKIGANIYELMQLNQVSISALAIKLGYKEKDIRNVIEGKVIVPTSALEKIATVLGTTKNSLVNCKPHCSVPELQYMKEFSNPEHLDKIIDLMDEYVECREAI